MYRLSMKRGEAQTAYGQMALYDLFSKRGGPEDDLEFAYIPGKHLSLCSDPLLPSTKGVGNVAFLKVSWDLPLPHLSGGFPTLLFPSFLLSAVQV